MSGSDKGVCLRDQNRRNDEFSASLESALRVLDVHHGAASDQDFAIVFLAEVSDTVCSLNLRSIWRDESVIPVIATYQGTLASSK